MCLYSDGVARIADKDIRVWKKIGVSESLDSWKGLFEYNDKVFPFDEVCEEERRDRDGIRTLSGDLAVSEGFFHSFNRETDAERIAMRRRDAFLCPKTAVVECTIPKGARYYVNVWRDEFASDRIIVHKPKNI